MCTPCKMERFFTLFLHFSPLYFFPFPYRRRENTSGFFFGEVGGCELICKSPLAPISFIDTFPRKSGGLVLLHEAGKKLQEYFLTGFFPLSASKNQVNFARKNPKKTRFAEEAISRIYGWKKSLPRPSLISGISSSLVGVRNGIMLMAQAKKRRIFSPHVGNRGMWRQGQKVKKKGGRGKKTTTISRILPFFFRFLPRVFLLSSPSAPHLSKVLFCVFSQCLFFCGKRTVSLHFQATKVRYFLHLLPNFFIIIGPSSTQTLGLNPSISFLFPERRTPFLFPLL